MQNKGNSCEPSIIVIPHPSTVEISKGNTAPMLHNPIRWATALLQHRIRDVAVLSFYPIRGCMVDRRDSQPEKHASQRGNDHSHADKAHWSLTRNILRE